MSPPIMESQNHQLHFILFPLMAQGHMIPMIDMARLFAQRGIVVTIVLTPLNVLRFKTILDRAVESSLPIRVLELYFPCEEAGLPVGCENADTLPSRGVAINFFAAISMLQQPLEKALGEMLPIPSCIISDYMFPWTTEIAYKFDIPRVVFHGTSCITLLCSHNVVEYRVLDSIKDESEPFLVPGFPDPIEVTKANLPAQFNKTSNDLKDLRNGMIKTTAYGVVVNSFYDLEPGYLEGYQKAKQGKVWCVGPVSLTNKDDLDKIERGSKAAIDKNHCLKWLDSREENSVIYVCLGSLCRLIPSQLIEIGLGLETSKVPFIWVIRKEEGQEELEKWLSEERFEERTKDRGLIIKGWAPQVLILSHQAIGGFLTHCGWNSTLEGVSSGVPMITWPMFADQFLNEKLLVQVLGVGVRVGVDVPCNWGDEEEVGVLVRKEGVEEAVNKLMDKGEEGEERRRKARELEKMASNAMEEGGSSYLSMTFFIEDVKHQVRGNH